jgi:hypothetical protein
MTTDDPVNLRALRDHNRYVSEPSDTVHAVSLTLAAIGGLVLLAITIGSICRFAA